MTSRRSRIVAGEVLLVEDDAGDALLVEDLLDTAGGRADHDQSVLSERGEERPIEADGMHPLRSGVAR